jgi:putative acetyltransferase
MQIRPFRADDAPKLAEIFYSAIHQIASGYYSNEQIDAWAPKVPAAHRFLARGSDGRILLVATGEHDEPIAYGDVEAEGHIDHLFCHPSHAGKGVAGALLQQLQVAAKSRGIECLYVEASEPARGLFLKHGFLELSRNDFELNGVPIHNFRMEKRLAVPG